MKFCGYSFEEYAGRDAEGFIYRCRHGGTGEDCFVRIAGQTENVFPDLPANERFRPPSISHEIIISDPPCERPTHKTHHILHPVALDNRIFQLAVTAEVRRPGIWTTSAIRAARQTVDRMKNRKLRVLDMGCGCGAIGVFLASHANVSSVTFSDISQEAVDCAAINARTFGLKNSRFKHGDLFEPIGREKKFDLMVFLPPYYPGAIATVLPLAETGGDTGIEIANKFMAQAAHFLTDTGACVMLLPDFTGYGAVKQHAEQYGLTVETHSRDIFYPYIPKFNFPPSPEILHRDTFESTCSYSFRDETLAGRKLLGFKMITLTARRNLQTGGT